MNSCITRHEEKRTMKKTFHSLKLNVSWPISDIRCLGYDWALTRYSYSGQRFATELRITAAYNSLS